MDDLISRQVLDLWNRYKPTIAVDAIEYDRKLRQLLSTNLAEVGTDRTVKGFPIDADDLMLRVEEKYGFRSRDRLYDIIRKMPKYELPSAEPKRGKWFYQIGMIKCDQCLRAIRRIDHDGLLNFCPNCGANMRGEQYG